MTSYITLACPKCDMQKEVLRMNTATQFSCNCGDFVAIVAGKEGSNFMLTDYTVTYKKLMLHHVNPPIPVRDYDWQAYLDGEEERGHCGWGANRRTAVIDLLCEIENRMEG